MGVLDKVALIGAIRNCTTRGELECAFEDFNIYEVDTRYNLIVEAMYSPKMFFSGVEAGSNTRLELAIELFLTMGWKASRAYREHRGDE